MKELVTFRKYLNEGIINEELTPIQQYVYDYEIEVSGEDMAKDFLDSIEKLKNHKMFMITILLIEVGKMMI